MRVVENGAGHTRNEEAVGKSRNMQTPSEEAVADVLREIGFNVSRIPTVATEKRADLRAAIADEGHIIEVKTKVDDPAAIERHLHTLETEGEAIRSTSMGRNNRMSGVFREAASQLRATPCQSGDFKLIWFMAIGRDQGVQVQQFEDTLYGTVPIIVPAGTAPWAPPLRKSPPQPKPKMIPCYFYSFNEFFAADYIDGAVISLNRGYHLCMNSHGRRLAAFRRTKLHELFAGHNLVVDPEILEAKHEAFIADCDIDRRKEPLVLRFVREKYGLDRYSIAIHGSTHVAEAIVPTSLPPARGGPDAP